MVEDNNISNLKLLWKKKSFIARFHLFLSILQILHVVLLLTPPPLFFYKLFHDLTLFPWCLYDYEEKADQIITSDET